MSFSRAAEDLHLTQPAISAQIKALEGHAGLPLFERVGRKLQLTAAGAASCWAYARADLPSCSAKRTRRWRS